MDEEMKTNELDDLDMKILELLAKDSRMSYREISKRLGTSHANISHRIRRLEEDGVIRGYSVVVNPEAMNLYPLCIRVSVGPGADPEEIGKAISKLEDARMVLRVSGDCELLALGMSRDRQYAINLLTEISRIPGVEKAESHVVLESMKLSGKILK